MSNELLQAQGLKKYFNLKKGIWRKKAIVKAVDDVDLKIGWKETVGLVGESGCGKTTLGRLILGLINPTEGHVFFKGQDLFSLTKSRLRSLRKFIQIIFQDPFSSLNPRMTVRGIIGRNLKAQKIKIETRPEQYIGSLLEAVGLRPEYMYRYPHEFSGGQRQRIAIARAIATRPELIIADEPTSALDVSVQAQILNLLRDLQKEHDIAYLFISHNINVVKYFSQRVGVMYLGKIVEMAPTEELFADPRHPYTRALLDSMLEPNPKLKMKDTLLSGEVPSPINPPSGCCFHPRCSINKTDCRITAPSLMRVAQDHYTACYYT